MGSESQWSEYLGRTRESEIIITTDQIRGLAALLDYPEPPWPEQLAPPTAHWLTLFPHTRQSELGRDGHEKLGGFLPPLNYPRRMWAGGRVRYTQPLPVDAAVRHRQTLLRIEDKKGRSGAMTLVTVLHEFILEGEVLIADEQDIVYRDIKGKDDQKLVHTDAESNASSPGYDWSREILPDTVLLFRYSAISFNSHRIHYDLDYAKEEGYPGILVHGPLTATLLIDLFQRSDPAKTISRFDYAARRPMFAGEPFTVMGRSEADGRVTLLAVPADGIPAMTAEIQTA